MRNAETIFPNMPGAARWIARIVGVFLVIFIIFIFLDEGKGLKFNSVKTSESMATASFVAAVAGLLLGWVWEGLGGLITILGLAGFTLANYYAGGPFVANIWVLAIPAVLFIYYWWATH